VRIALENVWNRFLLSPIEMRDLVDSAGSRAVTALFDVGNCLAFGYPEHWIRVLGRDRLFRVHFKDWRRAAGITTAAGFVAPLAGDVNWPAVLSALDDVGYAGPLTVEVACGAHMDPAAHLGSLAASLRALHAMRRTGE
jgi:hexulose-6-phosphate isomerase